MFLSLGAIDCGNLNPFVESISSEERLEVVVESRTCGEVQLRRELLPFLDEG